MLLCTALCVAFAGAVFATSAAGGCGLEAEAAATAARERSEVTVTTDFLQICVFACATDDDEGTHEAGILLVPAFEDAGRVGMLASMYLADRGRPVPITKNKAL